MNVIPTLTLMFAHERSGTHLLRSLVAKPGEIAAPGEICNASADIQTAEPLSFFSFRRTLLMENPAFFLPTEANTREIMDEYFSMVRMTMSKSNHVILDIKYSHVPTFNTFWWNFIDPPFLIRYARDNGIKIIHLVRKNVFETAISGVYAEQSGVWRATDPTQLKKISIKVDIPELRKRMKSLSYTMDLFNNWLKPVNHFPISYEQLTGLNPEEKLNQLAAYIGYRGSIGYAPKFVKTTPPYSECISNWDEVRLLQTEEREVRIA